MTSLTGVSMGTLDTNFNPMAYKRARIGWLAKQLRLLAAEGNVSAASVEQSVALALSEWPVSVEELKGMYRARL